MSQVTEVTRLHHWAQLPVLYLYSDLNFFISLLRSIIFNYVEEVRVNMTPGTYRGQRYLSLLELELQAVLSP